MRADLWVSDVDCIKRLDCVETVGQDSTHFWHMRGVLWRRAQIRLRGVAASSTSSIDMLLLLSIYKYSTGIDVVTFFTTSC